MEVQSGFSVSKECVVALPVLCRISVCCGWLELLKQYSLGSFLSPPQTHDPCFFEMKGT